MTAHTLRYAVATALLASLALAGCKKQSAEVDTTATPAPMSTPAPVEPATPPPAMDNALTVSSVTLGKEAGADKTITASTTEFSAKDPIIVSVATSGAASDANIHARLVYEDGQVAGEESQAISANGMDTTNFIFKNTKGWPTGSYTAEVSVNDAAPHNTAFTVK